MINKRLTMLEQVEDLRADLAGCEAIIEDLEAKNAALQKRIDEGDFGAICAVRRALREAGISDSLGPEDGIRSLGDIIESFRAHAAESEREKLRAALRDLHTTSTERNDWKVTAQSLAKTLEEVNEKYFDLLGDSEIPGMRSAVRKFVRRALEVVR